MLLAPPPKLTALLPPFIKRLLLKVRKQVWRLFPPRHLFVFGGRRPYWASFGCDLYAQEPVFRATVQECEQILLALGGRSLLAHFEGPVDTQFLTDESRLIQFVTVIQLALVELWRAYGVEPDAVMGVSNGEPAAIYAAGGLSLTDTLRICICWAHINHVEPHLYGVLTINADYTHAKELCAGCPVGLFITVVVDPTQQILYCALTNIEDAKVYLRAQGVSFHQFKTEPTYPYHTPVLNQHAAVLGELLTGIIPRPTTKPCYLTTTGCVLPIGTLLPWDYWLQPIQEPAYQHSVLQAAISDGYFVMTSIGVYPFSYANRTVRKQTVDKVRFLGASQAICPEAETFTTARQQLLAMGLAPR